MNRAKQALEISNQWLEKYRADFNQNPTRQNRAILEWEKKTNARRRRFVEKHCK